MHSGAASGENFFIFIIIYYCYYFYYFYYCYYFYYFYYCYYFYYFYYCNMPITATSTFTPAQAGCVALVDAFQFRNEYMPTHSITSMLEQVTHSLHHSHVIVVVFTATLPLSSRRDK